ncbi:tetratricopeptide repeat protein 39C-like [Toxorhynchites rutilus septentrionalis]|uniref:tetratricopeptide repeat protein 39C-like n=1 Tax=Toxorhynchites rutilus septentrionalis TaxID=329112 RepID=UPI00247AE0A7|nr:tetratricopeptide repeat protein 39C-like [Toxorhynchites rutilus septentrionalis]XP_055638380.1 tetratricopeptide repeat protein 39C-like [Toxorhynchites rutilus septentrionalis]XP_055638381.1 tetratricopeptide repeat protein 39C-like [Toxorhynchites rutilus septentrionalis]XP_055638382.1 tetratricopeptide repeat protein 39C-like [Toxorhynchites rutilus septentrionalis]XP_055638383.1 tetratricopeptide repeat protein 39C-like [Toxorhynchites rutilus septentrionalis]
MASSSAEDTNQLQDWEYIKQGIALWLNNQPKAAEECFKNRQSSIHIVAGHTFIAFMNAVISWETEKMNEAQNMLRELEKMCAGDIGWLKSMRTKLFGADEPRKSLADALEEQIILADTQLCLAILVSLSQDIGGFVKGGWLLRKAWKVYQHTYSQIYQMYNKTMSCDGRLQAPLRHNLQNATLDLGTPSSVDWTVPNSSLQSPDVIDYRSIRLDVCHSSTDDLKRDMCKSRTLFFAQASVCSEKNEGSTIDRSEMPNVEENSSTSTSTGSCGSVKKSLTTNFEGIDLTMCSSDSASIASSNDPIMERNTTETALVGANTKRDQLKLDIEGFNKKLHSRNGWKELKSRIPPEPSSQDVTCGTNEESKISPEDISRLMGAVSFGYGVFQLSISLLPPSLLKLISFLGFEGDRKMGIACLMHSKASTDMRAPLSTLALLWYFTIVTPFFAVDGSNLNFEIHSAQELIDETSEQFSKSSLFLFFRGRVERLKSNIKEAIQAYEIAYRSSVQREIRLLCLHEIGWCRLIQLDYGTAMNNFKELRRCSQFSKSFYAYLTVICQGSHGYFSELIKWRLEIADLVGRSSQKESQIEKYIFRRCLKLPRTDTEKEKYNCIYWKLLAYEMLFMWNALNSCSEATLTTIIEDCNVPPDELIEPSVGLSYLILGACLVCLKRFDEAIDSYRKCIAMREDELQQDVHISAFANYELAMLLLKQQRTEATSEAKQLLLQVQQSYRNFDFDNRINVRIHSMMKKLN